MCSLHPGNFSLQNQTGTFSYKLSVLCLNAASPQGLSVSTGGSLELGNWSGSLYGTGVEIY